MGKPNNDDSQFFDQTSSSSPIPPLPPPPSDFDMNWQTTLSQSEPSIQSRQNQLLNRLATTAYNSYKVSIGHEKVNITEIARQRESSPDPTTPMITNEKRRIIAARRGANILSLCFMCFVSACLILIAISTMQLILRRHFINNNDIIPQLGHSNNITLDSHYKILIPISTMDTVSNLIIPAYDRTLREFATVICLSIIVLNCFCILIFSIEIYLGCNIMQPKNDSHRSFNCLFSSSTARFIAICSFYASIPAFILVMCIFILLNMSLIPAIISLSVLGFGLIFILLTLLTYVSLWQNTTFDGKLGGINGSIYHTVDATHLCDDDIDLAKTDELSTLV
ncbi:unnamed protein product [Adineta steineri]|uniref:Uncharacterized protein n=1 Tax=Adineta steineri TaxID=433720 RepID=A0A814IVQ1_9BILA|nr:unnamed protein product [Adineta steineri]CAF1029612.1 unnamed protein product [Adineta steineri]CAF1033994.1 unnamed protein product [Adineta steineri]CAF1375949.1 unnamed protein product [Adineta steineri]CAF1605679.1 unnamed protein product [Adineta steineri]